MRASSPGGGLSAVRMLVRLIPNPPAPGPRGCRTMPLSGGSLSDPEPDNTEGRDGTGGTPES